MANEVKLSVRSDLLRISDELKKISDTASEVGDALKETGAKTDEAMGDTAKKTEKRFSDMRGSVRRAADSIKDDFKALLSFKAIQFGDKLTHPFQNSIKEAVTLSDTIRRLSPIFGIVGKDFAGFQSDLLKGMGDIGLGSEQATNAISGLAETQVRGKDQLIEYSKAAGALAQIGGEKGQESTIAKGMAEVATARGIDPNNIPEMKQLGETLKNIFNTTGMTATKSLGVIKDMFAAMPQDLRKKITPKAMTDLAIVSAKGGPNATKFLEKYLSASPTQRLLYDAFGFKDVVTKTGVDFKKLKSATKSLFDMYKQDPRLMAQQLGLGEDEAEGMVRMSEAIDSASAASAEAAKSVGTLVDQLKKTRGLGESFKASIEKTKSTIAKPFAELTQGITEALSDAAETKGGAAAVTSGSVLLAALLTGGGLRGLSKFFSGQGKKSATEAISGKDVQDVYVVNASEIGGGGIADMAASGGGLMGNVMRIAGIAGGVAVAGMLANELSKQKGAGITIGGEEKSLFDVLGKMWDTVTGKEEPKKETQSSPIQEKSPQTIQEISKQLSNPILAAQFQNQGIIKQPGSHNIRFNVTVDSKDPKLETKVKPSVGGSN